MKKSAEIHYSINPFSKNYCHLRKPFISYYKKEKPINIMHLWLKIAPKISQKVASLDLRRDLRYSSFEFQDSINEN